MFRGLKLYTFLICIIGGFASSSYADERITLKVGLITPDRPPYFFAAKEGQKPTGLYIDILEKVTENLPITLEYSFLPQARIRRYMDAGKLDIEPGVDKSWRTLPNEIAQSIYTIPFMESHEVYAYIGDKIEKIDFNTSVVCAINGFDIPDEFKPEHTQLVTTENQLYALILKKRCDLAIAPIDVINYWNKKSSEKINMTTIIDTYQLRLRLNKQHKSLINSLNSAIKEMQNNGSIEAIKQKYIQ